MNKIFVIAGNYHQGMDWAKQNIEKRFVAGDTSVSLSDYVIVSDVNRIRGVTDPHGVFIGTWIERDDLESIFIQLLHSTNIDSVSHRTITKQWALWKNSQGKLEEI